MGLPPVTAAQTLLFPRPSTPEECARAWCAPLLDEIPVRGHATAADWRDTPAEAKRWPGRNHPRTGAWLVERYLPEGGSAADPMIGVGGLWIRARIRGTLYGGELEMAGAKMACHALVDWPGEIKRADARLWWPPAPCRGGALPEVDLVLFSPPFLQNHSAGATAHQEELRDGKRLHAMQAFGTHPLNIGRLKGADFWLTMERVYTRIHGYARGHVVVILRNYIRQGMEVDEVGDHIQLLRESGFEIAGVHPRDLVRPTAYQAWKVARDPRTPWIRWEYAVVARRKP